MADTTTGAPYTPTLQILDDFGAPVVSGVSGTMIVTGPTGATVAGGVAYQGDGEWGTPVSGSFNRLTGTYKYNVATLTVNGTPLYDQGGTYVVGEPRVHHRTLREIVVMIYTALQDGIVGTGTGGTNTLTNPRRAGSGLDENEWIGSELVILGPAAAIPATNPLIVDAFNPATGEFTVTPDTTLTGEIDYLLCNRNGAGKSYLEVREVIDATIGAMELRERVTDTVSLTTTSGREYAAPAGWRQLDSVALGTLGDREHWEVVAPGYWEWDEARQTFRDKYGLWPTGLPIRLCGVVDVPPPNTLGEIVPLRWTWVRDMVLGELLATGDQAAQRKAALHVQRAASMKPSHILG